jgi:hypothetical protein
MKYLRKATTYSLKEMRKTYLLSLFEELKEQGEVEELKK